MKQDWTEQLRRRLADYEEPAPDGLWEAIEQRLQQEELPLASQDTLEVPDISVAPARRVLLRRWMAVAASVLVLLTAGVALLFLRSDNASVSQENMATPEQIVANITEETVKTEPAAESPMEGIVKEQLPAGPTAKLLAQLVTPEEKKISKEEVHISTGEEQIATEEKHSSTEEEMTVEPTKPETQQGKPAATYRQEYEPAAIAQGGSAVYHRSEKKHTETMRKPLTVSLRGANLMASNGSNAVSTSEPIYMARGRMNSALYADNSKDFEQDPVRLIDYADDTEHQHPLTVGLTVSIPFTDRLWIETGLMYTRAKSTFTTRMGRNTSVYHQRLQYVGVPLGAGYTFWRSRLFQAYGVAGMQADVNVDAHLETDGLQRHLDKDRLLLSVGGRAGAEYRFLPRLGVYIEPGLRYYIDNDSRLQTVFKEKPLQFDFQLGVRYSLK